jgi:5-methylcytosine-specific restriction protein A
MALKTLRPRLSLANTYAVALPPKEAEPFYSSPEWRALLTSIIGKRGRRCEDPTCKTPHGPWGRIYGDHIKERRDGGADLDEANVLLRCATCHGRKTAAARGARAAERPTPTIQTP